VASYRCCGAIDIVPAGSDPVRPFGEIFGYQNCRNAGTAFIVVSFSKDVCSARKFQKGNFNMNRRDQELLDRQLSSLHLTPRNDGVMILAILAVFLVGMTVGGFLYAFTDQPMRIAANDVAPAASPPYTPQILRR
jgi:hypothetical protein